MDLPVSGGGSGAVRSRRSRKVPKVISAPLQKPSGSLGMYETDELAGRRRRADLGS